jgi:hypothetical protein
MEKPFSTHKIKVSEKKLTMECGIAENYKIISEIAKLMK